MMKQTPAQPPHEWTVCTRCMTYNHEAYIEDALRGFTMQQTTFPTVSVIVDDASTDGNAEAIRRFLEQHFDLADTATAYEEETDDYTLTFARHKTNPNCHFAVLLLKENHYSQKKPKLPYLKRWTEKAKYHALCEGDDYWIDPQKLQKQVDFLEGHEEYAMCCNRVLLYSVRRQAYVAENYCYKKSRKVEANDIIQRGGLYIPTCSMIFRPQVREHYPSYCSHCHVGDYPLQIMCAMKGGVYYFHDKMSVYRIENPSSWVGRNRQQPQERRLSGILSEITMLKGFSADFPMFSKVFRRRIAIYINRNIPRRNRPIVERELYKKTFSGEISAYSTFWKTDLLIREYAPHWFIQFYSSLLLSSFQQKRRIYR